MVWAGRDFYVHAWTAIRHGSSNMNTLISVGTGAAFLFSLVATVNPGLFVRRGVEPQVYYEAVVLIIAFVLAGRALEARAKRQTSSACIGWSSSSRRRRAWSAMASRSTCRSRCRARRRRHRPPGRARAGGR